jgi:hypothetical protein
MLEAADQTRALTRLWLVNDGLSGRVPTPIRARLQQVLRTAEAGAWYHVGSVAQVVAAMDSGSAHLDGDDRASTVANRVGYVTRDDVVQGIAALHWIGVLDAATNRPPTIRAIRLTVAGMVALA